MDRSGPIDGGHRSTARSIRHSSARSSSRIDRCGPGSGNSTDGACELAREERFSARAFWRQALERRVASGGVRHFARGECPARGTFTGFCLGRCRLEGVALIRIQTPLVRGARARARVEALSGMDRKRSCRGGSIVRRVGGSRDGRAPRRRGHRSGMAQVRRATSDHPKEDIGGPTFGVHRAVQRNCPSSSKNAARFVQESLPAGLPARLPARVVAPRSQERLIPPILEGRRASRRMASGSRITILGGPSPRRRSVPHTLDS